MSHVSQQQQREKQQEQQEQQANNVGASMRSGYHDIFAQDASNGSSDSEQPQFRKRESFPETSKLVGLIRDVGTSIKDRTLGRKQSQDASAVDGASSSATTSHSSSSSGTTPVINVVEAPPTMTERPSSYRRRRTSSIKGKTHQTEEELGTPVNIYLEHRVHLEQDKRARTDLDTRLLGETLYVPQSPTIPDLPLSSLSTPYKPTHTDGIDSWWAYNNLLGSCGSAVVGVQHPTSGFTGADWRRIVL